MAHESESKDNVDFSSGSSGASDFYPLQCSALRKNGFVLIRDRPCKIVEMHVFSTGKHGRAKIHFVGIDIFTQRKYEDNCQSSHNRMVPNVIRKEYIESIIDEWHCFRYLRRKSLDICIQIKNLLSNKLLDISDDGFVCLLDDDKNETRSDINLPEGVLGKELRGAFESEETVKVILLKAMGEEHILGFKVDTK